MITMDLQLNPSDLKDYAMALGWTLVEEAIQDGLFVLNGPNRRQLAFVSDGTNPKFEYQVPEIVDKLAHIYQKSELALLQEIREKDDDTLKIRFFDNNKKVDSLSFEAAINAIEGAKQLLQAAANTTIEPKNFFKGRTKTEVAEFINHTKFRHTEEGSFVLKISTPLNYPHRDIPSQLGLFGEVENNLKADTSVPFERKIYSTANYAIAKLVQQIDLGKEEEFAVEQVQSERPLISYNLLDAISGIFDQRRELPIELKFGWSLVSIKKISPPETPSKITIPFEYKRKIENFKRYYDPVLMSSTDTFIGMIDSLQGEDTNDGREGNVILKLLVDGESVSVKVYLNKEFHHTAINAYAKPNTYIKIHGRLSIDGRSKKLEDIELFEPAS